jgi:hypothetical protein
MEIGRFERRRSAVSWWYGNEDAGDLSAANYAGYMESLAEDGLTVCEVCERTHYEDEECQCGGEAEEGGCEGCEIRTPVYTFLDKQFCEECYQAVSTGRATTIDRCQFAHPGGRSALRAAGPGNPRVYPCPNCKAPGRLTALDRQRGYQCDRCADAAERGLAWDE